MRAPKSTGIAASPRPSGVNRRMSAAATCRGGDRSRSMRACSAAAAAPASIPYTRTRYIQCLLQASARVHGARRGVGLLQPCAQGSGNSYSLTTSTNRSSERPNSSLNSHISHVAPPMPCLPAPPAGDSASAGRQLVPAARACSSRWLRWTFTCAPCPPSPAPCRLFSPPPSHLHTYQTTLICAFAIVRTALCVCRTLFLLRRCPQACHR